MTKNGKLILEIIENSFCHPTAEDVYFEVKKRSPGTVMATVYNNLNSLVSQGSVRRIKVGGADRFDKTSIVHDHLVCDTCGEIEDIFLEDMTDYLEERIGDTVNSYSLIVHHTCKDCLDRQ